MVEENEKTEQQGTAEQTEQKQQDMYVNVTLHMLDDGERFQPMVESNIAPYNGKDADGISINPNYTAIRALLYGCVQVLSRIHPDYKKLQEDTIDKMTDVLMDAEAESINRYIQDHPENFKDEE